MGTRHLSPWGLEEKMRPGWAWGFLTLQQPQTQECASGGIRWSRFLKELREALGASEMS